MIVWIGLYPQPIINTAKAPLNALQESAGALTSFEKISYPAPTGADRDAE
jgi:hypothetical protein